MDPIKFANDLKTENEFKIGEYKFFNIFYI